MAKRRIDDNSQSPQDRHVRKLTNAMKLRILEEKSILGWNPTAIARKLNSTGVYQLKPRTVARFLHRFEERTTISNSRRTRQPAMTADTLAFLQAMMQKDSETTARQLHKALTDDGFMNYSLRTIYRWRRRLGWVFAGSRYCQAIRVVNVANRRNWAKGILKEIQGGESRIFDNIVFTDECKVQLERHKKRSCRRVGFPIPLRGRHKHPTSVLVWGGISVRGRTKLVIFKGIMLTQYYIKILKDALVPTADRLYGHGNWKLMQDNDPKHTATATKEYFESAKIKWWKTPAESPDINPIENVWGSMKEYLRSTIKPKNLQELIGGIKRFWTGKLNQNACQRYIYHLYKVVPAVYEKDGMPTGY